jgi:hypothetical protein
VKYFTGPSYRHPSRRELCCGQFGRRQHKRWGKRDAPRREHGRDESSRERKRGSDRKPASGESKRWHKRRKYAFLARGWDVGNYPIGWEHGAQCARNLRCGHRNRFGGSSLHPGFTVAGATTAGGSSALAGLAWSSSQTLQFTFNVAATDQVTPILWLVEVVQ